MLDSSARLGGTLTGLAFRVASNVAASTTPVIDDVICKLINTFDFWVARLVVYVEISQ